PTTSRRPRPWASAASAATSACTSAGRPRSAPNATRRGAAPNAGSRRTLLNEASSGIAANDDLAGVLQLADLGDDAGAGSFDVGEAYGAEHLALLLERLPGAVGDVAGHGAAHLVADALDRQRQVLG